MLSQTIATTLQALIAVGLVFQFLTLTRCAMRVSRGRAARPQPQPIAAEPAPVCRTRTRRRRDYRVALRLARASVAA